MYSEIAGKISSIAQAGEVSVAAYTDSQLQEVRAVLTRLAPRSNVDVIGHCWCSKNLRDDAEPHDKNCQLARALWQRLQPTHSDESAHCRQVHLENERSYRPKGDKTR